MGDWASLVPAVEVVLMPRVRQERQSEAHRRGLGMNEWGTIRTGRVPRATESTQTLVIRNRRNQHHPDDDCLAGGVSSTVPESSLSAEQRHLYYHRPSVFVTQNVRTDVNSGFKKRHPWFHFTSQHCVLF